MLSDVVIRAVVFKQCSNIRCILNRMLISMMFPFSQCTLSDFFFLFFCYIPTRSLLLITYSSLRRIHYGYFLFYIFIFYTDNRGITILLFSQCLDDTEGWKHSKYTLTGQFIRKTCTSACPCNYLVSQSCGSRVIGSCRFRSRIQVGTDLQKLDKHQRQTLLNSLVRTWSRSNLRFVFLPDRRETQCGLPLL